MFYIYYGIDISIDATKSTGMCRLVNDSKKGNSKMRKIVALDGQPYLCLFATKDIEPGWELRYNYGESPKKMWWRDSVNYQYCYEYNPVSS